MTDIMKSADNDKLCGCLELPVRFTDFSQEIETVQSEEQGCGQQAPRYQVEGGERICEPEFHLEKYKQEITFKDKKSVETMRAQVAKM